MIRRMEGRDIDAIVALGKTLHASMDSLPPVDEMGCRMLLARALCHKRQLVLVHEKDTQIVGVLFGMIQELWYSKTLHATDIIFYSQSAGGAFMLRRFIRWAKSMGVTEIDMAVSSGKYSPNTTRMFERAGFQNMGSIFKFRGNQ